MQLNILAISPIAVLLFGVVLQGLLAHVLSSTAKGWLAFATSIVATGAVLALWPVTMYGHALDLTLFSWDGPIAFALHVDGLSQVFALMGAVIGAAVLLFSVGYMSEDPSATRFYSIMQVFIAGLIGLVYAKDLLLMYAFWEIVGLCSFLLVSFWYTQPEAAAGARKVLVMTHIAGYALLAAIITIYVRTGTTLWTDPRVTGAFSTGIFALMLTSAVAKSVQFPLHTWIPSAMAAPTPVSALLHAACYVKAGVYLVARMHSFAPWPVSWQMAVVWLGTATMLVGVLFAMIQHDAKRLLAFHTVSQIGYMMLGLGLGTPLGVAAALLHTLNHGLFKGGLFLGAGAVQHATGTRDMDKLGGLARKMPTTTILWLISAASIAGVPLFNGFVSKWLLYVAAMQAGYVIPALIAWMVSIFTMFSFMKASASMFFGEEGEASGTAHESPKTMLVGSGFLAALCVVFGVAPQLVLNNLISPALGSMGLKGDIDASWLGVSAASTSFYAASGLVLAVVSLLVGLVLYLLVMRRTRALAPATTVPVRPAMLASTGPAGMALAAVGLKSVDSSATFTGGEALSAGGRLRASDFSVTIRRGLAPFYDWVDPDRYYLGIWHGTLAVCAAAGRVSEWLEQRALAVVLAFAAVIGVVAATASGVTRTTAEAGAFTQPWPLIGAIGVSLVALLLVQISNPQQRRFAWLAGLSGALVLAGLIVDNELARLALLEGAAFGAVALLVVSSVDKVARNAYLGAAVLSAVALAAATFLLPSGSAGLVLALFLVGFAIKLALVPTYLWLPAVARTTPAALVGMIVAVIDVAAFGELIALRQSDAWLFEPTWPWLALALVTAIGGAGLMLAQRQLKLMVAFSTVVGAGFIVLGVTLGGPLGVAGATAAAAADALAMGLLFACLAAAEADGEVTLAASGIARKHPFASAGFVLGSLTALGVPFTAGYAGHWRIYVTAFSAGWFPLVVLEIATILSVLAYVRAIALVWWGGDTQDSPAEKPWKTIWTSERAALVTAIALLMLAIVTVGLVPRIL